MTNEELINKALLKVWINDLLPVIPQQNMRDVTPEEQKMINDYIKSISKPTGVDFGALQQEPCEDG